MTEAMVRNKPGMASVKDMPVLQDGPPPGGFAPVRYARRIPSTGPSAIALFLTTFGAFSWGMYQVGKGNKVRWYFIAVHKCLGLYSEDGQYSADDVERLSASYKPLKKLYS